MSSTSTVKLLPLPHVQLTKGRINMKESESPIEFSISIMQRTESLKCTITPCCISDNHPPKAHACKCFVTSPWHYWEEPQTLEAVRSGRKLDHWCCTLEGNIGPQPLNFSLCFFYARSWAASSITYSCQHAVPVTRPTVTRPNHHNWNLQNHEPK